MMYCVIFRLKLHSIIIKRYFFHFLINWHGKTHIPFRSPLTASNHRLSVYMPQNLRVLNSGHMLRDREYCRFHPCIWHTAVCSLGHMMRNTARNKPNGPHQANLVLIAYASSEGSGEPAHPHSLARIFTGRSYKQWIKRNLQTVSQVPGPSEWLGMRSCNLSWWNAQGHKFAWRGSNVIKLAMKQYSRWALCKKGTLFTLGQASLSIQASLPIHKVQTKSLLLAYTNHFHKSCFSLN